MILYFIFTVSFKFYCVYMMLRQETQMYKDLKFNCVI